MARGIAGNKDIRGQGTLKHPVELQSNQEVHFPYSTSWLILSFAGLVTAFILINKSPIYIWIPVSVLLVTLWVLRYKRAMRQLSRPRFWIFFVVITVLSAVLISSLKGSQSHWTDGLIIGLQMNFRAAVVIVGFSVLGTELYNPAIRSFLARTVFKQLPAALELAFESFPFVVANLPDAKTFIKNPADVIALLISYTEDRFNVLKKQQQASVFIITGDVSEGKTGFLVKLLHKLRDKELLIGGFYAPRIMQDGKTLGYDLVSVETENKLSFLRIQHNGEPGGIGKFKIDTETLEQGKRILSTENCRKKDVVIIDEIGRLELQGRGWSSCLENLLAKPDLSLIITVREDLLNLVLEKFEIRNFFVYPVSETNITEAEESIVNRIAFHKKKA
jgi:nucleoside-triphosphatase THEP1